MAIGTEAGFARAVPAKGLPGSLQRQLGVRRTQKAPTKERSTIRLSPEIVAAFRASARAGLAGPDDRRPQGVDRDPLAELNIRYSVRRTINA